MNIHPKLLQAARYIARYLQLQLFLTLVSLPIILVWGLPISLLAPLGNLIFGPALTLFLLLSSLIFFCELLHIPTTFLIHGLEYATHVWLWVMHTDMQRWLISFVVPPVACIALMIFAPFIIMLHKKLSRLWVSLGTFCCLFLGLGIYLKSVAHTREPVAHIPCNKGNLTLITTDGTQTLIDPGYLGQRINAASYAQYTVIPAILKKTGITTIDHLIILQPSTMIFKALECFCTKMNVKKIYLVVWDDEPTRGFLRNYFSWKRIAESLNIEVVRLTCHATMHIPLEKATTISISPLDAMLKTATISFPALCVSTQIDNQKITLYSAKYAKKQEKAHLSNKNNNRIIT